MPCAPINTYSQVLADPQVEHMQWVQPLELPNGVADATFASPMRFSGEGLPVRLRPPALGEHNDEVLGPLRGSRSCAMSKPLRIERRDGVWTFVLQRPDKRNAHRPGPVERLLTASPRSTRSTPGC